MPVPAYIALGSNLGDRRQNLDRALELLRRQPGITVGRVSSYHETAPVGGPPGQGPYLNAAAELQTELEPERLLTVLLDVEQQLGRVRREKDGPRTLDLDLLLYGAAVRDEERLTLPHPRLHERLFVLGPLAEVAADVVHPHTGRTIAAMRADWPETTRADAGSGELAGRRAVVTGSTSGIGRAIALELAAAGAEVAIHGRRGAAAEDVAAQARARGVRSRAFLADLRDPDACRVLVDDIWDRWGAIDVWINNAGADTLTGAAGRWPFERKLEELWAVDVRATLLLGRAVGARMKARGAGVILNMGWDQADTGMEGDSGELFAATKGAVMAFSRSLALSLAPAVRVNCIAPGWIQTAWGEHASAAWQERVRRETPLGRWGTPADVAAACRWLASPAAAFITGQTLYLNGGAVCS